MVTKINWLCCTCHLDCKQAYLHNVSINTNSVFTNVSSAVLTNNLPTCLPIFFTIFSNLYVCMYKVLTDFSCVCNHETLLMFSHSVMVLLFHSVCFKMAASSRLSDDQLRKKLREFGIEVGPITTSTRPIYERKLNESQRKRSGSSSSSAAKKLRVEPKPPAAKGKQKVRPPANKSMANGRRAAIRATMNKGKCNVDGETAPPKNKLAAIVPSSRRTPAKYAYNEEERVDSEEDTFDSLMSVGEGTLPQPRADSYEFAVPRSPSADQPTSSFPNLKTMLQLGVEKVKHFFGGVPSGQQGGIVGPSVIRSSSISSIGEEIQEDMHRHRKPSPEPGPSPPPLRNAHQIRKQKSASSHSDSHSEKYDWELEAEDVHICRKGDGSLWSLGKGGFGVVYKGIMGGVDEVAVKVVHMQSPVFIEQFKHEIDMISKLRHRHIVQFYGACIDPSTVYMVTELMQTDLFSALRRLTHQYRWSGVYGAQVAIGIASGIHYLHSRKPSVVHRDIKSPNILLMDSMAKIADVGLARTKSDSDMTAQKGFTAAWAAPEVVYRRRATEKIDIWSFGIILWEIVTGQPPRVGHLNLPLGTPTRLRSVYAACTSEDPQRRPPAGDVIQHLKMCLSDPS